MKKYKGAIFRLYPTQNQEILIHKTFGCCRFVYNCFLQRNNEYFLREKKALSYEEDSIELTKMRKGQDFSFLKEVSVLALRYSLKYLHEAFNRFRFSKGYRFPKFKSRKNSKKAFTICFPSSNPPFRNKRILIPKIGLIKFKQKKILPGTAEIKMGTVWKTSSGKYFLSVIYECENQVSEVSLNKFLGLDFSMSNLYVDSEGKLPYYPHYYRNIEHKLKQEQRKLSHMLPGSHNYYKQQQKIARIHEKVGNQRKDFLHKQSKYLAENWDYIFIEDLNLSALQKGLHFGKSINDEAWGKFVIFLQQKLSDRGKKLMKIDKFYPSSQLCSICGFKNEEMKDFSIRKWDCPECGAHHDRDVNAAINIRNEGMRLVTA